MQQLVSKVCGSNNLTNHLKYKHFHSHTLRSVRMEEEPQFVKQQICTLFDIAIKSDSNIYTCWIHVYPPK